MSGLRGLPATPSKHVAAPSTVEDNPKMTSSPSGSGVVMRLRLGLIAALVALLTVGLVTPAIAATTQTTTPPPCDGTPLTDAEAAVSIQALIAFAQQYSSGTTTPTPAELDLNVGSIVALVEYVRLQAEQLPDAEVATLLAQLKTSLVGYGIPDDLATQMVGAIGELLASQTPITAEVVLAKIYQILRPYLIAQGGDPATIDAVYGFLVQLLLKYRGNCPPPVTPPAPGPETVTPSPTTAPTATAAPPQTSTPPASSVGGLAATGLGTPALLAIVALLMIGAGLSMAAADRRVAPRSRADGQG